MSSEHDNLGSESDDSDNGILATVSDTVFDLLTGTSIPAPIRKNALKAFGQLCTAIVDIPVAHLEGIATEKRAETQARIKIISTGAHQIAAQMDVEPEYAHAAVKKYGQKIIREQINLDKVSEAAARQISQDSINPSIKQNGEVEVPPINDDWLNHFEKEACQKSTQEMQLLFGRILAGEIQRPSSFAIKTVNLLSNLDSRVAVIFRRLCSLSVSMRFDNRIVIDARIVALNGNAAANSLQSYGLSFDELNVLHEYGLIIPDYNSYFDYRSCIANQNGEVMFGFTYQNRIYGLVPSSERHEDNDLRLSGVALSRSGRELLNIVDIEPAEEYTTALKEYFKNQHLEIVEIKQ